MKAVDRILPGVFLALVLLLVSFGVLMIYSTSLYSGAGQYYYFRRELIWVAVGLVAMWSAYRIPLETVRRLAPLIFGASLLALLLLHTPLGIKVNGATRWIGAGFLRLQPSETMKYALVILLAWWYDRIRSRYQEHFRGAILPLFFIAVGAGLALAGDDLGTPVLIAMVAATVCLAGGINLLYLIGAGILGLAGIVTVICSTPYRRARVTSFLNPLQDVQNTGLQVYQSLLAITSGKWSGVGLGHSMFKAAYLPEAHTDFIFAIICEELGFYGAAAVIGAFLLLLLVMLRLISRMEDRFCRLASYGIALTISLQACINIGVVTSSIPNKGMGLPFISYGGSSLVFLLAACGLFLNMVHSRPVAAPRHRLSVSRVER